MNQANSDTLSTCSETSVTRSRKRVPKFKKKLEHLIETVLLSLEEGNNPISDIKKFLKSKYDEILSPESQDPATFSEILQAKLTDIKISVDNLETFIKIALTEKILNATEASRIEKELADMKTSRELETFRTLTFTPAILQKYRSIPQRYDQYLETILREKTIEVCQTQKKVVQPLIEKFLKMMEEVDFKSMGLHKVSFSIFGSNVNNFGTSGSDIDVSLNTENYVNERELLRLIYECYFKNLDNDDKLKVTLVAGSNVRIPLIKFDFVVENYTMDLCVNNVLGVINSKLLQTYAEVDDRCAKLGKLVKMWAKNNGICSGQNAVSSYGFVLMVINYLQMLDPPVLPSLQMLNIDKREPREMKIKRTLEYDRKFDEAMRLDFEIDVEKIKKSFPRKNTMGLWTLLTGFFEFFAEKYPKHRGTLSVKHGHMIPRKPWTELIGEYSNRNADQFYISIADPFDYHDPGRNLSMGNEARLRDKFQEIYKSMLNLGTDFDKFFYNKESA